MSVIETSEPTAAQEQLDNYNSARGQLRVKSEFTVPADTHWAIVGLVLADVVTPADVTSDIVPDIEDLTEVTSVNGDQLWGQIPASILTADHEAVLHVNSIMSQAVGTAGDYQSQVIKGHGFAKPPVGKKWVVVAMVVPSALDNTKVATLETALQGVTGVTTAEHLIHGSVDSEAVQAANLVIWSHTRIDATEA